MAVGGDGPYVFVRTVAKRSTSVEIVNVRITATNWNFTRTADERSSKSRFGIFRFLKKRVRTNGVHRSKTRAFDWLWDDTVFESIASIDTDRAVGQINDDHWARVQRTDDNNDFRRTDGPNNDSN